MPDSDSYRSAYVPSVQFRGDVEDTAVQPYIEEKLKSFFRTREDIYDLDELHHIPPEEAITDIDFYQRRPDDKPVIAFDYLYKVVMNGARKIDGEIDYTAYTLTFDHEMTPHKCEKTETYYGSLKLANEPVLYYIRLDLSKLISEARSYTFLP